MGLKVCQPHCPRSVVIIRFPCCRTASICLASIGSRGATPDFRVPDLPTEIACATHCAENDKPQQCRTKHKRLGHGWFGFAQNQRQKGEQTECLHEPDGHGGSVFMCFYERLRHSRQALNGLLRRLAREEHRDGDDCHRSPSPKGCFFLLGRRR